MKTKILKFSLLTVILGVALWSCKKDEPTNVNSAKNTEALASQQAPFTNIQALNNGKSFNLNLTEEDDEFLSGDFLGSQFNHLTFSSEYWNEISSMTKLEDYSYTNSSNSTIQQLSFSNFNKVSPDEFTVDVTVNNSTVPVTISNNGFSMLDFQNRANDLTSQAEVIPLLAYVAAVAVVGAVTWVADASLEYCQTVITQGTQNCSANGKCAQIDVCSVTCYTCPD